MSTAFIGSYGKEKPVIAVLGEFDGLAGLSQKGGVFDDVDIALSWYPWIVNSIKSVSSLFRFKGRSSHAAAGPHLGRSALDTVELMNVGVNYLREHIIPEAIVHYVVTSTGGISPNVVQANAEVLYLIRAPRVSQVDGIYTRIVNIAKGAALMTDTDVEVIFDKGCSNYIPNKVVEDIMFKEKDLKFAKEIKSTLSNEDIDAALDLSGKAVGNEYELLVEELRDEDLCKTIVPFKHNAGVMPGSTDVGDVSWDSTYRRTYSGMCSHRRSRTFLVNSFSGEYRNCS